VYDKKTGWAKARQRCQKAGGDLAVVEGKEDEDALVSEREISELELIAIMYIRPDKTGQYKIRIDRYRV